jgi:hypothetical protein
MRKLVLSRSILFLKSQVINFNVIGTDFSTAAVVLENISLGEARHHNLFLKELLEILAVIVDPIE